VCVCLCVTEIESVHVREIERDRMLMTCLALMIKITEKNPKVEN